MANIEAVASMKRAFFIGFSSRFLGVLMGAKPSILVKKDRLGRPCVM
jgi:hypothetical protein